MLNENEDKNFDILLENQIKNIDLIDKITDALKTFKVARVAKTMAAAGVLAAILIGIVDYGVRGERSFLAKKLGLTQNLFKDRAELYNIIKGYVQGVEKDGNMIYAIGDVEKLFGKKPEEMKGAFVPGLFADSSSIEVLLENLTMQEADKDSILHQRESKLKNGNLAFLTFAYKMEDGKGVINTNVATNEALTEERKKKEKILAEQAKADSIYWTIVMDTYKKHGVTPGIFMNADPSYLASNGWIVVNQYEISIDSLKKLPREVVNGNLTNIRIIDDYFRGLEKDLFFNYDKFQETFGEPGFIMHVHKKDPKPELGRMSAVYSRNLKRNIGDTFQDVKSSVANSESKVGSAKTNYLKTIPRSGK